MDTDEHRLKKYLRKGFSAFAVCVTIYVASYILNSFFGGYWLRPEMDGRDRYSFGLSMPTAILWQPLFGHEAIGRWDYVGVFFKPLIRFDRKLVHTTIYISDETGEEKIANLKIFQVHPHWRDECATQIKVVAVRDESEQAIKCTFRYTGSDHPREIAEIRIRKELAKALDVSPPSSFIEKHFDGVSEKLSYDRYVRWIGKLALPKNQDVILAIPTKHPQAGIGRIVFYYQRTDNASRDFKNICGAELK
jgi:hypothetical protein